MAEKNALAELAERLTEIPASGLMSYERVAIRKAQRIVAELAKVEDVDMLHNLEDVRVPNSHQCYDAIVKCRAIAEEVDNVK